MFPAEGRGETSRAVVVVGSGRGTNPTEKIPRKGPVLDESRSKVRNKPGAGTRRASEMWGGGGGIEAPREQ